VVKDMFEIKRANEILLSENDVTQDMLEKLERAKTPSLRFPANPALQNILYLILMNAH